MKVLLADFLRIRSRPRSEGATEIVVQSGEESVRISVDMRGLKQPTPISFEHQILPLLTKASCNSGGCHGKAEGQNGFKFSVFDNYRLADSRAIVMEGRGRRLFASAPEHSLFVVKATVQVPHGGGRKIEPGSIGHKRLGRWIAEGARVRERCGKAGHVDYGRTHEPRPHLKGDQQLQVTAIDSEGVRQCITTEAEYESNATTIAGVDGRGWIRAADVPGEEAILFRYIGQVAVCRVTVPQPGVAFPRPPEVNFIDKHVWDKLGVLGIAPSDLADDAVFLRRVSLGTIGTLPTEDEARTFLASKKPNKWAERIDLLLERSEYADFWAQKWPPPRGVRLPAQSSQRGGKNRQETFNPGSGRGKIIGSPARHERSPMTVFAAEYVVRAPGLSREWWAAQTARAYPHYFDDTCGLLLVYAPDEFADREGRFHPLTEPEFQRLSQIARYWLDRVDRTPEEPS